MRGYDQHKRERFEALSKAVIAKRKKDYCGYGEDLIYAALQLIAEGA